MKKAEEDTTDAIPENENGHEVGGAKDTSGPSQVEGPASDAIRALKLLGTNTIHRKPRKKKKLR